MAARRRASKLKLLVSFSMKRSICSESSTSCDMVWIRERRRNKLRGLSPLHGDRSEKDKKRRAHPTQAHVHLQCGAYCTVTWKHLRDSIADNRHLHVRSDCTLEFCA